MFLSCYLVELNRKSQAAVEKWAWDMFFLSSFLQLQERKMLPSLTFLKSYRIRWLNHSKNSVVTLNFTKHLLQQKENETIFTFLVEFCLNWKTIILRWIVFLRFQRISYTADHHHHQRDGFFNLLLLIQYFLFQFSSPQSNLREFGSQLKGLKGFFNVFISLFFFRPSFLSKYFFYLATF